MGSTGEAPSGDEGRNRRRDLRLVLTGIVVVLLAWFALANLQEVKIHFWISTTRAPLIAVIAIAGVLGAALWALAARRRRRGDQSPHDHPHSP